MFKKKKDAAAAPGKKAAPGQKAAPDKKTAVPKGKGLPLAFLDKFRKKKGGGEAEAPKNACPQCGVAFQSWISYCTRCKVPLQG